MKNLRQALHLFLLSAFTAEELRRVLYRRGFDAVVNTVPERASLEETAQATIAALERHNLVARPLFDVLRDERPTRRSEIDAIEALADVTAAEPAPDATSTPVFRWLADRQRDEVYRALIRDRLADQLETLLGGIAPEFVGMLPSVPGVNARLLAALDRMNGVKNLRDGSVPLKQFLSNAALLASASPAAEVFESAIAQMKCAPGGPRAS